MISWTVVASLEELFARNSAPSMVAIDIPIGLPDRGPRLCDQEARTLLKPMRATSVFPAPIRPLLDCRSHAEASALRLAIEAKGLSIQSWAIVPKIRDIDQFLRENPIHQQRVREVHPEVCFYFMAEGRPMSASKKTSEGRRERLEILRHEFGEVVDRAVGDARKADYGIDDLLDAFAGLWTARRIIKGEAVTLPAHPPRDSYGLPMEMVA